jgi:soluble P-type ATPase/protein-L-isoaspartate O-methyltransferase
MWLPTRDELVTQMLTVARVTPEDLVVDLGAGDGKIAIAAARQFGARAWGIEYNKDLAALAQRNAQRAGVADRVRIVHGDIFKEDFSKATVVTMYLLEELNARLRPAILAMRPGTRVLSNSFSMGDWEPDQVLRVGTNTGYFWTVPASVAGQWSLQGLTSNGPAVLRLSQRHQRVGGTLSWGGQTQILLGVRLHGADLHFSFVQADGQLQAVQARVQGRLLRLGSTRWLSESGLAPGPLQPQAAQAAASGQTVSWLFTPGSADTGHDQAQVLGLLTFGDQAKAGAAQAIARLRARGLRVVMVSGDNQGAAESMARTLGIDEVRAEVLPGDKARVVGELKGGLPAGEGVAMVGDGVNDAPALAAADVGLAMAAEGAGTDVAVQTAGLTLLRGDPAAVVDAWELSWAIRRKLRQNLSWAFAYNVVGIPLAALGFLSPVVAGAAMAASSVSVISNALLLRRFRPE